MTQWRVRYTLPTAVRLGLINHFPGLGGLAVSWHPKENMNLTPMENVTSQGWLEVFVARFKLSIEEDLLLVPDWSCQIAVEFRYGLGRDPARDTIYNQCSGTSNGFQMVQKYRPLMFVNVRSDLLKVFRPFWIRCATCREVWTSVERFPKEPRRDPEGTVFAKYGPNQVGSHHPIWSYLSIRMMPRWCIWSWHIYRLDATAYWAWRRNTCSLEACWRQTFAEI